MADAGEGGRERDGDGVKAGNREQGKTKALRRELEGFFVLALWRSEPGAEGVPRGARSVDIYLSFERA